MKYLYINEPAPWEEKAAYYSQVKMGKDLQKQTQVISRATQDMISAQMSVASDIIASQDRVAERIDSVGYAMEDIKDGLAGLAAAFEWGISQVVWQLEQNREILRNIVEILVAPLDTQAKELKKRADEAYANEWFDDALVDYQASEEKNKYDFTIHMSMGMIYLFNIINKEKALEYFDKATKYAKPKSNYHASIALLHKALCLRDMDRLEEALHCAEEAHELTKEMAEAYYQCSIYEALLKNSPKLVTASLDVALDYDKYYALKANKEPAFDHVRKEINECIIEARKSNYDDVRKALPIWINVYDKWSVLLNRITSDMLSISADCLEKPKATIARINQLIKRNSFFDSVEAKEKLIELEQQNDIIKSDLKEQLQEILKRYEADLSRETYILIERIKKQLRQRITRAKVIKGLSVATMPLSMVGCVVQCAAAIGRPDPDSTIFSLIFLGGLMGAIVAMLYERAVAANLTLADKNSPDVIKKSPKVMLIEKDIEKAKVYLNNL